MSEPQAQLEPFLTLCLFFLQFCIVDFQSNHLLFFVARNKVQIHLRCFLQRQHMGYFIILAFFAVRLNGGTMITALIQVPIICNSKADTKLILFVSFLYFLDFFISLCTFLFSLLKSFHLATFSNFPMYQFYERYFRFYICK